MPTPRPFNAPTEFKPQISPQGEIERQVARMKEMEKPATSSPKTRFNPFERVQQYLKGNQKPKVEAKPVVSKTPRPTKGINIPGGKTIGGIARVGGLATAISPDKNLKTEDRVLGGLTAINPLLSTAVAAGATIGNWMEQNLEQSTFQSGRGAGRTAFSGGQKPAATPQALDSGMTNRSGVTPVVPEGGTSPSFRSAVEQGADGGVVPSTLPASVKPSVGNMANSSELERYKVFAQANPEIAKRVKPGQAGYEEIQAVLGAKEGGMSAEDILGGMEDSFGKTAAEVKAFNSGEGNEVLIGFDDPVPTGRNTEAPVPGDIPQKGTAMGSSNVNLTPGPQPGSRPFTSIALAGTEGGSQQRDLTAGVPSVEPIADALDQSRAVTVDQSPTGKEFFNKYFNRTFGR